MSILGQPHDPKIPEKSDLVFICNTYHHIQDRSAYFENMKQYMQPDGRLVIVDFKKKIYLDLLKDIKKFTA